MLINRCQEDGAGLLSMGTVTVEGATATDWNMGSST